MSVNFHKKHSFTGVGVMRDSFSSVRNHFDIHVEDDGISGYTVWHRNSFRIPILSHINDILKKRSRNNKNREDAIKSDHKNFTILFEEIQGIVTYDEHKEIQVLSSTERLTILFRPIKDYDNFITAISEKISEKIFKRDMIKVKQSVYI